MDIILDLPNQIEIFSVSSMFRATAFLGLLASASSFVPNSIPKMGLRSVMKMSTVSTIREGASVPECVFKCRVRDASIGGTNPFKWKDVSTTDLFKGKRVALFALPGGT